MKTHKSCETRTAKNTEGLRDVDNGQLEVDGIQSEIFISICQPCFMKSILKKANNKPKSDDDLQICTPLLPG